MGQPIICERIGDIYEIVHGNQGDYIVGLSLTKGIVHCTCPYYFHKRQYCKHIKDFLIRNSDNLFNLEIQKPTKKIPSSLDCINEMFEDDLYNNNEAVALAGFTKLGKSLFAVQESIYLASNGYNVLYLDTEGSAQSMIEKWSKALGERFDSGKDGTLVLPQSFLDYKQLCRFLGWDVEISWEKKKPELLVKEEFKEKEINKIVAEKKIDIIIVDSITSILKVVPASRQNFPTRAGLADIIFSSLNRVMDTYGTSVLTTHHISKDPVNPFPSVEDNIISGGAPVFYNSKRVMLIDRREHNGKPKKDVKNYRRFWLIRDENHDEYSRVAIAKITNSGYHSVDDPEEAETDLTKSEVARLEMHNDE